MDGECETSCEACVATIVAPRNAIRDSSRVDRDITEKRVTSPSENSSTRVFISSFDLTDWLVAAPVI